MGGITIQVLIHIPKVQIHYQWYHLPGAELYSVAKAHLRVNTPALPKMPAI
jgi:hypothetical protein